MGFGQGFGSAPQETQRISLPDGRYIDVPTDFSEEEWEDLGYRLSEMYPDTIGEAFYKKQRTPLRSVLNFAAAPTQGAVRTGITALQGGLGLFNRSSPIDIPGEDMLARWQSSDVLNPDPEYQGRWLNQLGQGMGSMAPFVAAYSSPGGQKAAALLGAAVGAGEQTQRLRQYEAEGGDVGSFASWASTVAGAGIGMSEAIVPAFMGKSLPVAKILSERQALRGLREASQFLARVPGTRFGRTANAVARNTSHVLLSGALEGTQEGLAQVAQNVVSRVGYDEDLRLGESALDEALMGGQVGALMAAMLRGATGIKVRRQMARIGDSKNLDDSRARIGDAVESVRSIAKGQADSAAVLEAQLEALREAMFGTEVQGELGMDEGQFLELMNAEFDVVPSIGGGYRVIDKTTGMSASGLEIFETSLDARNAVNRLNNSVIDIGHAAGVDLKLRGQGLNRSVPAIGIGMVTMHPDISMFPTIYAAQYDSREELPDEGAAEAKAAMDATDGMAERLRVLSGSLFGKVSVVEGENKKRELKLYQDKDGFYVRIGQGRSKKRYIVSEQKTGDGFVYRYAEEKSLGAFASFMARHSDARAFLTATEVIATIGEEHYQKDKKGKRRLVSRGPADNLFLDRAVALSKIMVEEHNKIRAEAEANGQPTPVTKLDPTIRELASLWENVEQEEGESRRNYRERLRRDDERIEEEITEKGVDRKSAKFRSSEILDEAGDLGITAKKINHAMRETLAALGIELKGGRTGFTTKTYWDDAAAVDPGFAYFLESVTGTARWDQMTLPQKALAVAALKDVPVPANAGRMATGLKIPFPDLRPITYSNAQHAAIETLVLTHGELSLGVSRSDPNVPALYAPPTNEAPDGLDVTPEWLSDEASTTKLKQIFYHLSMKGIADVKDGISEGSERLVKRDQVEDISQRTTFDTPELMQELAFFIPEEDGRRDSFLRYLELQIEGKPEDEKASVGGAPEEVSQWAFQTSSAIANAYNDFKTWLIKSGYDRFVDLASPEEGAVLLKLVQEAGQKSIDPNATAAFSGLLNKIFLFGPQVDPKGEMTPKQVYEKTLASLKHEIIHYLIQNQYLTDSQMDSMARTVRQAKVPEEVNSDAAEKNLSWYDFAKQIADSGDRTMSDVAIEREALALYWENWTTGKIPKRFRGGVLKSVLNPWKDIFDFAMGVSERRSLRHLLSPFASSTGRMAEHDARVTESIFSKLSRGDFAEMEPGISYVNPQGEIRAPRYLVRTAPSKKRAKQIVESMAEMSIYQVDPNLESARDTTTPSPQGEVAQERAGSAFASAGRLADAAGVGPLPGDIAADTKTYSPHGYLLATEVRDQIDMFGQIVDDVTGGLGRLSFLEDLHFDAGLEVEVETTEDGPVATYRMELSGENSDGALWGIAKMMGEALGMDHAEVRAVVRGGGVGNAAFGIVLDITDGVNVKKLSDRIYSRFGPGTSVQRIGDQLYIIDEKSMNADGTVNEDYTEVDAINFSQTMRDVHPHTEPSGFFLNVNRFAQSDGGYEGGLQDLEGAYDRRAEDDIEGKGKPKGLPRPEGPSDLRSAAINRLFEPIYAAIERRTSQAVERTYFDEGSSIPSPVNPGEATENKKALTEHNAAIPPGYVLRYGDMSPVAGKTIIDAFRAGMLEDTPAELAPEYSTPLDVDPEMEDLVPTRSYTTTKSATLFSRMFEIFDSPDTYDAFLSWAQTKKDWGRYFVLDKWSPVRKLTSAAARLTKDYDVASSSADGAATLMVDRIQNFIAGGIKSGIVVMKRNETETDPSATALENGGMAISEEGVTASDGAHYKNWSDVFRLLSPAGHTDMRQEGIAHDYMIALRSRWLYGQRVKAEAELEAAEASGEEVSPERRAKLEEDIKKGTTFPGLGKVQTEKEITDAKAHWGRTISHIEAKYPNIVAFQKAYRAMNLNTIQFMVDTGEISTSSFEYQDMVENEYYVPFYRRSDPNLEGYLATKYSDMSERAAQRLKIQERLSGSAKEIDIPLVDAIMGNYHRVLRDGAMNVLKNRVVSQLHILNQVLESGEGVGRGEGVITYFDRGVQKWVRVADPLLVDSLSAGNVSSNGLAPVFRWLGYGASKVMRELITRTPNFMVGQALRDPISAWATSGAYGDGLGGLASAVSEWTSNFAGKDRDAVAEKATKYGLMMEHDSFSDQFTIRSALDTNIRQALGRDRVSETAPLHSKTWESVVDLWDSLGMLSKRMEIASRMSVWERVYEETGDEFEATAQALEVINFGRRGASPQLSTLMAMIPFMNARIQGLDVMWRSNVTGEYTALPKKGKDGELEKMDSDDIRARAWGRGAMLVGMTLMYRLAWLLGDEDEYQNTRKEVREDNWLVPNPWGLKHPFKIPIPFEVGVVYKAVPEIVMNAMLDQSMEGVDKSISREVRNTLSLRVMPQVLSPLWDAYVRNRNNFTGYDIVPKYMEEMDPQDQRTQNTSSFFRTVGDVTGMSPMKLEYAVQGYLPGLGAYLWMAADAIARAAKGEPIAGTRADPTSLRNIPILSRVSTHGGGFQQTFYDLDQQVSGLVTALNRERANGNADRFRNKRDDNLDLLEIRSAVNDLATWMKDWRRVRDVVLRDTTISGSERKEKIKRLEKIRDETLAVVPVLQRIARGN